MTLEILGEKETFCVVCKKPQRMDVHSKKKVYDEEFGKKVWCLDVSCTGCGDRFILHLNVDD